ncbi:PA14 domain-containing protein [Streptomyces sp. NPDC049837]|uniref:fibronectin type III domain-containing protein n=1 Tax=Streptomyces sp. NPDC049837 TaxID=3155277 RepID=UPI00343A2710
MITRTWLSALATTAALAATGGLLTATPAAAAVTCASPIWKAQFFANTSFSGTPKLTSCDTTINENYGTGDPAGVTLPRDNFSVRWSVTRDFGSGGPFTFSAATQDGIRVYLDGVRKIDLWRNVSTTQSKTVNVTVPAGPHTLRVDYVAWTGSANVKFTYAPRTAATVDTVRPLAPTGTSVAYDRATNKATLRWSANKEMDLAGYRVYRRLSSTAWAKVSGTALVTGTSFVNYPPATGESFLYQVRAVDKAGRESLGSADQTVASVDRTAPAAPGGLTATDGQGGTALAWQPVPGAAKYTVFRQQQGQTDAGGPHPVVQMATVTSASWTDTTAAERTGYTYAVSASDAAGNTSVTRSAVSATHGDYAPAVPTGVTAQFEPGNGIVVNWTRSTSDDVSHYRLYRFGAPYVEVWGSTYTDMSVRHGSTYTYTVTAVDEAGNESPVSASASATTDGDLVAPAPVTGLKATAREDGVLLEWQPSTEPDLKRYELFKAEQYDDGEGGHVWLAHRFAYIAEDTTSFLHGSTADGETVMYAVVAVDDWGNSLRADDESVNWVEVTELGTPSAS